MQDTLIHNPNIAHFNPIQIPEPVEFWPMTLGWYILGVIALILIGLFLYIRYKNWQRNRYRRVALQMLSNLQYRLPEPSTRNATLLQISELLKRVAMKSFSREKVARLTGQNWLEFLTKTGTETNFTKGVGLLLIQVPYQSPAKLDQITSEELQNLISLSKRWIRGHHV